MGDSSDDSLFVRLEQAPLAELIDAAGRLRDEGHGRHISYSRKVFIPLTHLCRDVCHYCTFAQRPRAGRSAYLSPDEVLAIARAGAAAGCTEALFTLGDKPELRWRAARDELAGLGYETTIDYLQAMCALVLRETGLLPHANPGIMSRSEMAGLRTVSASQGIMLESLSVRLCEPGGVHYGSPDKRPEVRLETLRLAGELRVPFTTGILIGIGETRAERLEALFAIRDLHRSFGHIQEVIVQNFRAKPGTKLAGAAEPDLDDLLWSLAAARLILGPTMNIQAPPNLSPGVYPRLIAAGINDWGGISPVTPDHVNPEAPWPVITELAERTASAGKLLVHRLPIYPSYARDVATWSAPEIASQVLRSSDAEGLARDDDWAPGTMVVPRMPAIHARSVDPAVDDIVERALAGDRLDAPDIVRLFAARDADYRRVVGAADGLRRAMTGDTVRYVVNRNINYTNICYYRCQFCAFSKGKTHEALRGAPYDLALEEIVRRATEAWERGATEVCLQGGIHPQYTGETYLGICRAIKAAVPDMHIHAFSPLEVTQGAATLGIPIGAFLAQLKAAGLSTLPGTAAEILDDEVRADNLRRQGEHGRVARCREDCAWSRPAHHVHDHVRPYRASAVLGAASARFKGFADGDGRLHRIRAVAVRAYGSADVSARRRSARADLPGSGVDACGGAAGAASPHHEHPDVLGQDGTSGGGGVPRGRRQRSRRHFDEREHLPRRGHGARPGISAGGDGGTHPVARARAGAAEHALRPGYAGAAGGVAECRRSGSRGYDAAAETRRGGIALRACQETSALSVIASSAPSSGRPLG